MIAWSLRKRYANISLMKLGRPLFYGFGVWHPYTTEFKPMYAISDALFIARKSDQMLWRYWFGRKPYLMEGLRSGSDRRELRRKISTWLTQRNCI